MKDALAFVRAVLCTAAILFSMFLPASEGTAYTAKNPDEAKLVFNVLSDIHVETNNTEIYKNFKSILENVKLNKSSSATLFLGDNTMNNQLLENTFFFGALKAELDTKTTIVAVGNHDVGNGEGDFNKMWTRFKTYNNLTLKNKLDKPYFYKVINGYYMIFLSTEELSVHSYIMSDEQIQWLKDTLQKASETGNPIFVFSHHPLDWIENENKYLVHEILDDYSNIYNVHGHLHYDFKHYNTAGIDCIYIPKATEKGFGMVVEVYDDEVVFRERNFIEGKWYQEVSFPITSDLSESAA